MVDDILADLRGADVFGQPEAAVTLLDGDMRQLDQLLRDILQGPAASSSSTSVPYSQHSQPSTGSSVSIHPSQLDQTTPLAPRAQGLRRSRTGRRASRNQAARQSRQARGSAGQAIPTPARPTPRRLERQRWLARRARFTEQQQRRRRAVRSSRWRGQYQAETPEARLERHAKGSTMRMQRLQYPIDLAWALTIHRVQGVSHDRAIIDLGKSIFAAGQAYVALSRVRSLAGVLLLKLDPQKVQMVDPRVPAEYVRLGMMPASTSLSLSDGADDSPAMGDLELPQGQLVEFN